LWGLRITLIVTAIVFTISVILLFTGGEPGSSPIYDIALFGMLISGGLMFIIIIPMWVAESLNRTGGRACCYTSRGYSSTPDCSGSDDCANCAECGRCLNYISIFGGIGFIINLGYLILGRKN
jgi:hypothetical protein